LEKFRALALVSERASLVVDEVLPAADLRTTGEHTAQSWPPRNK
jgi:hypothetical protein